MSGTGAGIDYSAWDHNDILDGDDVTNPYVDTPSLFRMRHRKHALMEHVAHQAIVMRSIMDLGRSLKVDPRGCFRQFFSSMKEAREELEEEEKRLGPGRLDPIEVYKSLPKHMQRSFDEKNIEMLHEAIGNEGKYHLARCIDSKLWVPESEKNEDEGGQDEDEEA